MDTGVLIGVMAVLAAAAALIGVALGRHLWPATRRSDAAALMTREIEVARLTEESRALRGRADQLEAEHRAAASEAKVGAAEVARLTERESGLNDRIAAQATQFADMQKQLTTEFENIANRVLKANASELSDSSQKGLAAVLDPLRERIRDFQNKIESTYQSEAREVLSLKEQIKLIVETSHAIGTQADSLAKALRGDSQSLGRWGELALERILEAAGLTEGREYVSQGRGLGLKSQAGGAQKPDIVVMLPEQRTMIIDSKVSLAGYERLIAAQEDADRLAAGDRFVRDVKAHIDDLSGKRYQDNEKLVAHDYALMFIPIEGALAAALARERELLTYASDRRVVLVGPSTLLMTMRTVASVWRYELQGQNAQEIARLAGELCDKLSASLGEFNVVAEKIVAALNTYNEAVKRLSTGRNNVLSIGSRMRELGVQAKRTMPSMVVDGLLIRTASEESVGNLDVDESGN
jgi:DNA recombination protein RmuC